MALIRNDLVCNGSLVEPPSAALKGYLWVADPRQVSFFCAAKRKSPKKRPPRSRRPLPALLARIGARLTRRARKCSPARCARSSCRIFAPRARKRGERHPRFLAPMLGGVYGDPKHQNTQTTQQIPRFLFREGCFRPGVFLLLNPRPSELSTAAPPRAVARLLFEPEAR